MVDVSVVLLTHNEEQNLPRCLESLHWCDDILVIDSGSTDATVAIAQERGARVLHREFRDFATQRNFAIDEGCLRYDWVLHLDADEVVTETFRRVLHDLKPPEDVDAYRVPSKTMLFGQWLRRAGMYPAYQVRLGRRDRLRFKQVGHGQREDLPAERIATFSEPYLHFTFSHGLRRWLEKHVRYANDEARELAAARKRSVHTWRHLFASDAVTRRRAFKELAHALPLVLRPPARFFYIYVVRRGFLDGARGATYALMLSVYEGMIAILALERIEEQKRRTESIAEPEEGQSLPPVTPGAARD